MRLSQALKTKQRIARELQQVRTRIHLTNSQLQEKYNEEEVRDLYKQEEKLLSKLVELKALIYQANAGIAKQMVQINELKAQLQWLERLPTRVGTEEEERGYGEKAKIITRTYVAFMNEVDQRTLVKATQMQIDQLQDEIDAYNATKDINFSL